MIEINKIYNNNCIELLKLIDDNTINLTLTSPPYGTLRDYNGYNFDFKPIANELYRITIIGGVIVWIVGDQVINGSETGTSFEQCLYFRDIGLNIHDTMIYKKCGGVPSKTRYSQRFEYMFILSKGKPSHVNLIKDRKNKWGGASTFGISSRRNKNGSLIKDKSKRIINEYGLRENVWEYATGYGYGQSDKIAYQHPATFPERLAEDHILSWSNEGDIVLDPMCGSGTTLRMAKKNRRNFIGIDISKEYCQLSEKLLSNIIPSIFS